MNEDILQYLENLHKTETNTYERIEAFAKEQRVPIMEKQGISFLQQLIRLYKPKRILEIGTAIGYSALKMSEAAEAANVVTFERDHDRIEVANENIANFNKSNKIEVVSGDALILMEKYIEKNEQFDFIFIDAAKGQYEKFFNLADRLLAPNGVIVTDNVLFKGFVANIGEPPKRLEPMIEKLQRFNEYIVNHENYMTEITPIGDGIAISIKK